MRGHIRRRGRNSWELKYDVREGGQRQTQYRSFKGTRREAAAELTRLLALVQEGGHVEPHKLTVGEYVRSRVAQWKASGRISAKTAERYEELVEFQLVPFLGKILLQRLQARDVEAWHNILKTKGRQNGKGGVSNRTVGHVHKILSKALKEGVRHGLVLKNVAADEPAPRIPSKEMKILSPAQVRGLPTKLAGQPIYAPTIVALFCGTRRGETLALRWPNIDLEGKTMRVCESLDATVQLGLRFKATKTRSGDREITLPDIVVDTLREHRRQQLEERLALGLGGKPSLVFSTPEGEPLNPNIFSSTWARVASELRLNITFQGLRHTHASQLIDAGVDVVTIAKRLGHSSPAITLSVYAHLFRKDDGKAAAAINAALRD
jgi:integrase